MLALAIVILAIVDNRRPWKRYQTQFFELERVRVESRLGFLRQERGARLAELEAAVEVEEQRLVERRDEVDDLSRDLQVFENRSQLARARMESFRIASDDEERRLARREVEALQGLIDDRRAKLTTIRGDLEEARRTWDTEREPIEALQARLAELNKGLSKWPFSQLVRVRQIEPLHALLSGDGSVDRCMTCHLGVAGDAAEGWPAVFRAHPRLDLFVATDSAHPYEEFGCTVCHGGEGRAVSYRGSGHPSVPTAEVPGTREEVPGTWFVPGRENASPTTPILPVEWTEASCARCHDREIETPGSSLSTGRRLIASSGCLDCHALDAPNSGPSLLGIATKTRPEWVFQWLATPGGSNGLLHSLASFSGSVAVSPERTTAEVSAIVQYLWRHSQTNEVSTSRRGDVARGDTLFNEVGCLGCHVLEGNDAAAVTEDATVTSLSGLGSKVSAGWLQAWLRDPRSYDAETTMPSLRLDEREAADVAAFLMTSRKPEWEDLATIPGAPAARDALVLEFLERDHSLEASAARLAEMTDQQRGVYLGERLISEYRCYACHSIPGFEDATTDVAPLSEVGRRVKSSIGRGASSWSSAEHQPSYAFDPAHDRAVTLALISAPEARIPASDSRAATLEEGLRLVERFNCSGCHMIDGRGPLSPSVEAPDLSHAGAKLRSGWLFAYLTDPGATTVRPWLKLRMPSFDLSDHETDVLTRYFAARHDRSLFTRDPESRDSRAALEVGRVVYQMLLCANCHVGEGEQEDGARQILNRSPSYHLAKDRLRPDWVVDWILDPASWQSGSAMPANFVSGGDGQPDSTFLVGSVQTPIFAVQRDRLRRRLGSEEAVFSYLSDPHRVASALRDYLWTLEE